MTAACDSAYGSTSTSTNGRSTKCSLPWVVWICAGCNKGCQPNRKEPC